MKITLTQEEVAKLVVEHLNDLGINAENAEVICDEVTIDLNNHSTKPTKKTKPNKVKPKQEETVDDTSITNSTDEATNNQEALSVFEEEPAQEVSEELDDDALFG